MSNLNNSTKGDSETLTKQVHNARKKPSDYFFDFFMLFLAVTLGFFVNNLNENQSERQREKQYMESLINDLKIDTAEIRKMHSSIARSIHGIDTVMRTLENREQSGFINKLYYYSIKYLNSAEFYSSSDRTISQLKSAGGLRLIRKTDESDSIVQYYNTAANVEYNSQYCLTEFYKIMDMEKEIFNFNILRGRRNLDTLRYTTDLKLILTEPAKLNYFYNQILMYTGALVSYNKLLTDLKKEAESLISFTNKNYKFD